MIDALITVRAQSSRLPNKCFLVLGDAIILRHTVDRCLENGIDPIISTTIDDDEIVDLAKAWGIRCFAGSVNDKLDRWLNTCRLFSLKSFVTIDCDDPLFDPELSKRQFEMLKYEPAVCPDLDAYLGSNGWGFRFDVLERICCEKKSTSTEMIWKHFPRNFYIKQFNAVPDPLEKNLRLTIDYEEDYWLLSTVVRNLGRMCSREQIVDFFKVNPGLRLVNDFRNAEWKRRQDT